MKSGVDFGAVPPSVFYFAPRRVRVAGAQVGVSLLGYWASGERSQTLTNAASFSHFPLCVFPHLNESAAKYLLFIHNRLELSTTVGSPHAFVSLALCIIIIISDFQQATGTAVANREKKLREIYLAVSVLLHCQKQTTPQTRG